LLLEFPPRYSEQYVMTVRFRGLCIVVSLLFVPLGHADCSTLPERAVQIIVPNTTGSAYDLYVRSMEAQLEQELRREIVVVNVAGGGGVVGARKIANATADGTTLGILNGAGLLTAHLAGRENVPNLLQDVHVLGRASSMQHVWAAPYDGALRNVDDLYTTPAPLVFAARNVASTSFVSLAIGAYALNLPHEFIVGYESNRETRLAALRGEVDVVSMDLSSGLKRIERNELRPLLQISARGYDHPILSPDLPTLLQKAGSISDPHRMRIAQTLLKLLGSNRLFVAPADLPAPISVCVQNAIAQTLATPSVARALEARAARIDYAHRAQVLADLRAVYAALPELAPIVADAASRLN
jgi:tripartite-type tricarboxylate transporter receptor subunit TctC